MTKPSNRQTREGAPERAPASISALIYELERHSTKVAELARQMRSQLRSLDTRLAEPALDESSHLMKPEDLAEMLGKSVRQVQRILKTNPGLKQRDRMNRIVVDAASFEIHYSKMSRRKCRKAT